MTIWYCLLPGDALRSLPLVLWSFAALIACQSADRDVVDTSEVTYVSLGDRPSAFETREAPSPSGDPAPREQRTDPEPSTEPEAPTEAEVPVEGEANDDRPVEEPPLSMDEPSGVGPTRYPSDVVHSPLTAPVVENLRTIAALDEGLRDDVFAKIGASSLDSSRSLTCFAGEHVDRDLMSLEALDALDLFLGGDAGGEDPFSRDALSAISGKTAAWVISGEPSPLAQELALTQARFGLIEYGTNDMHMGATYASALWGFGDALWTLTDALIVQGVIPVLHTNRRRLDSASADRWVDTYNAVIRGMAQGRQVPFLNQHALLADLPDHGLGGDGLHMSTYTEGGAARTCRFHDEAMQHGYNTRNLATVETLARLTAVVTDGYDAPDVGEVMAGEGTLGSPFIVDGLPFSALRDTTQSAQSHLDVYTGCGADQDESGPEHIYRLVLTETTRLRALVIDQGEVDIDLHLLDETASVQGCLARHDRLWEGTLGPGAYHFSLDTYVSSGVSRSGEYLFVLVACDPDDGACD